MAKKVKQQIKDIREEAKDEAQEELKVEGITPERKKKILKDWNKINIKLKEVELRNKKKEAFSHKLSGLEEFKQLNGKTVYSDALREKEQRDRDSMSLEMVYSQVEPMYRVVLEDMEKYIRPGVGKELINRCKIDRGLIRDLTGIINVLKFIEIKDDSRAKTAFLYFQLGENRINDIEKYFNVNLGSLFKEDIKQIYATAKVLGMSEKELSQNAATKMSSYSSQASDIERSITGTEYAVEMVSNAGSGKISVDSQKNEDPFSRLIKNHVLKNTIGDSYKKAKAEVEKVAEFSAINGTENPGLFKVMTDKYIKNKVIADAVKSLAEDSISRINAAKGSKSKSREELLEARDGMSAIAQAYCSSKSKFASLFERDESETTGIDSEREDGVDYVPGEIDTCLKRIGSIKKEIERLESALELESDSIKREEIQSQISLLKKEKKELDIKILPYQEAKRVNAEERKRTGAEIITATMKIEIAGASVGAEGLENVINDTMGVQRAAQLTNRNIEEILESVSVGELDPEEKDVIEMFGAKLTSQKISQIQNEKSLGYLLSQIGNPDKHKREKSISAILNYIYERVKERGNMLTKEGIAELEDALNQVKASAGNVKIGNLSVQGLEQSLKDVKDKLIDKEETLEESDSRFATPPTDKAAEDCVNFIKQFYTTVVTLPKAFQVSYTLEEVDKLQAQFDMCEAMIAEKGIVGDESFNTQRKIAKEKIENIRYRIKVDPILDTTEVVKLKTREERVEALRNNLKFLVKLIRDGEMRSQDSRQIRAMLSEYRKLRVLNWDRENGDNLQDIADMIEEVNDWSISVDMGKDGIKRTVDNCRDYLNETLELVKKGDFGPDTVKKWTDCRRNYQNLKVQYKFSGKVLRELYEKYEIIDQAFKENAGPSIQIQLIGIKDAIKKNLSDREFAKIDILKFRYESIMGFGISGLDKEVISEIDTLLLEAKKERTAKSEKGLSVSEQITDIGQEIKKMLNNVMDKGFDGFDMAKFNDLVTLYEYAKDMLMSKQSVSKSVFENIDTTIEKLKRTIESHESGKSGEKTPLTESDYEDIFAGAEPNPESGKKKGFTVAGPVEPEGAAKEIEESPLPEPEGKASSITKEGEGLTAEEIEKMQKK